MEKDFILLKEYCEKSHVDYGFIQELENEGLIETVYFENTSYIRTSQLNDLEMFSRLHNDLSINIEGIDVINNLLSQMRKMERELAVLRRQIDIDSFFYEDDNYFSEEF